MPTCRRKRVLLTEPLPSLLKALKSDPNRDVYYLAKTGEIFDTYEGYAARMSFYRLKQFQCEVTGRSGLDYFQALESEQLEARTMHSRFPEQLKPAILKAVQWQVMGRLDHLVEAVYERYKDRYFHDEKIYVDIQGDKFVARVMEVFLPQLNTKANGESPDLAPVASTSSSSHENDQRISHQIHGDLKISAKEVNAADDPTKYLYKAQILEEEKPEGRDKHTASTKEARAKWSGSIMEVRCNVMSRDRLAFSKSILRRFIRDCVDRDAAVASPWTVKPPVAARYGVDSVMPEATRQGVEDIKKGEMQKRKKVWGDKEGPVKKQKKLSAAREEKALALEKEREAEKLLAKAEAERQAAEKKKKKPVRYPTEDLDVALSEKEKKAGMKVRRPTPSRTPLPFNDPRGSFESFLMAWNFLVIYGQPLHLSTFTLDELEHAIRHSLVEPPCQLIAEIHASLIYNLRTVTFQRHSAVMALMSTSDKDDDKSGITIEELTTAMADIGNNWERTPLRHSEGREGWEESLVGCLKDVSRDLVGLPDSAASLDPTFHQHPTSRVSSPVPTKHQPSNPKQCYPTLPSEDKIAILAFMCNVAVSSKSIHTHMEACEEELTSRRKEKIELNRARKALVEAREALLGENKESESTANGGDDDTPMNELSELSDVSTSENSSEQGISSKKATDLRRKAQSQAHAKQREAARAKAASMKQAMAEHRRLDEEINKLERRLEGIEREFRQLLGSVRVKPMGKDRFYNRIWWFDGMGSASLLGSGGIVQYGTGRLFIQGPSVFDQEILDRREEGDVHARRLEEEGEEGMLGVGEWAVYADLEEVDEFTAWLNPKGNRELALRNTLARWWPHIVPGIRKRLADLNNIAKLPEARRSTRVKQSGATDISRAPYMTWTNRKAVSMS
ncbi:ATP-utilizing chromatin assembly and remodelling N-terminal-domain-containing protein [Multifurca ochricompacta]|uniref:ATP-utilizing chromatin assembly and remodelling N-terminal-domain-containing protein n=1 Tax=Multifurca ochricompacta TaxID=376703 RepID=A0AAD4ME00_9AGAM|nr:ATP-utilizing chromatin assembly and remodelling N-terminal-domain-containing protein [Multifurca ochricompacta]